MSACFCTKDVKACQKFYEQYFNARTTFDCGWYVNLSIGVDGPTIQFMEPQGDMPEYGGTGVVLNIRVDDVDGEFKKLTTSGLEIIMPLEDHPWGDRGFSVFDPIGTSIYIYSDREPSEEFKAFYKN